MKVYFKLILLCTFILFINSAYAYTDYFIKGHDILPYKYQKSSVVWSQYINSHYSPIYGNWKVIDDEFGAKCLSYAASTINDWYILMFGGILDTYQDYMNNRTENGTNPQELELEDG